MSFEFVVETVLPIVFSLLGTIVSFKSLARAKKNYEEQKNDLVDTLHEFRTNPSVQSMLPHGSSENKQKKNVRG